MGSGRKGRAECWNRSVSRLADDSSAYLVVGRVLRAINIRLIVSGRAGGRAGMLIGNALLEYYEYIAAYKSRVSRAPSSRRAHQSFYIPARDPFTGLSSFVFPSISSLFPFPFHSADNPCLRLAAVTRSFNRALTFLAAPPARA